MASLVSAVMSPSCSELELLRISIAWFLHLATFIHE